MVIKFRAWDRYFKRWSKDALTIQVRDIIWAKDYVFCQYKGLDKKGNEIYDGDIVLYESKEGKRGVGVINIDHIDWGNDKNFDEEKTPLFFIDMESEIEVIDNIFETNMLDFRYTGNKR